MMHPESKESHTAEECLLDLMKENLPPEEVIRRFKEKGYSLGTESEELGGSREVEESEESEESEEVEESEEDGIVDLKIKKVSVINDDMEEDTHPIPRMGKLIRVARKAMKKEKGE
tara:strand:+ start:763 stop:1110 length:348 start_codon:yes stop_codon:yes gene_type:complete